MKLTRYQMKILKYIRKPKPAKKVAKRFKVDFCVISETLIHDNTLLYVYENEPIYDDTLIQASNIAIAELEERRSKYVQTYIPIGISLIALIKSFSSELIWLSQQLMQLLR